MGIKRKFTRQKKKKGLFSGNSRSENVYNALTSGQCVECGSELIFKGNTFNCSSCEWEGEFEKSPGFPGAP